MEKVSRSCLSLFNHSRKRKIEDDEPFMVLKVTCPSTLPIHILRVPPHMQTCHQAAAWIGGFNNPDDYNPAIEA